MMENMITKDLTDEQMAAIAEAEKEGKNIVSIIEPEELFNNIDFVIQGSLKLMDGKFGGGFYVKFLQDFGSKHGWLELIIVYPDEQYKRVILCKNAMKETELGADNLMVVPSRKNDGSVKNEVPYPKQSMEYGDYSVFERYSTPQMPIPAKAIWKQIIDNYDKIPNTTICVTASLEEVYAELYDVALEKNARDIHSKIVNATYFLVTKEEMETVAQNYGMSLSELRVELSRRGLLQTDKSSISATGKVYRSYQFTRKVGGKNYRYYAIKRGLTPEKYVKADETVCKEYTEVL